MQQVIKMKLKICKKSGLEIQKYTDGSFCDSCISDRNCKEEE